MLCDLVTCKYCDCSGLPSITIPNSVTTLGDCCFRDCSSLTSITIPNSVTSLGDKCFLGCSSLTAIIIPNSVTSLGNQCFWDCSSLTSITIGNSVTSLGWRCFKGCRSLTAITIPNSVTSLGNWCFESCSRLTAIYMLPSTPPSTGETIFSDTPLETVYVVDEDAKTAYQAQAPWNEYEIVVMPTGIEEVETDKTAPTIAGYYDLNGKLINGKQRGAVIVRYSDGTTRKMLLK
ncbi:MAG: leucine-rich repeat domain-containing protein [Alloprevotella sp.]|nr:leucine-rich repeat domain-containing protein [Alloprevotella sp.]